LKGLEQAEDLATTLVGYTPTAFYSSPYLRAIQTLLPTSNRLGIPITKVEDYREHRMASVPIHDWKEVLQRQWNDWDHVNQDGESMRSTSERAWRVMEGLRDKHPDETVVLAGHGTIISLSIARLAPEVGLGFHLAMPNPAIYSLYFEDGQWNWIR
jgi:2,3-bisphosphoglycerate-dependent phosphoglycerate mutase